MAGLTTASKDDALERIAQGLWRRRSEIVEANRADLADAERDGVSAPLVKRLKFDEAKLSKVIDGVRSTISLTDPVGALLSARELDDGLRLYQEACPLGVLGIIFESRPDALVQISTLSLKSGNAVLLKGGREAGRTNRILAEVIGEAAADSMPAGWITLLETREEVGEMLALEEYIDLIIPRGSNTFVRHIMDNTNIPVMGHADGVCHLYLDQGADLDMARRVTLDSKTQYVAVCNAVETVLVDASDAGRLLPAVAATLAESGVELRGCERTREVLSASTFDVRPATDEDWATEYLDMVVAIRVVDGVDAAIDHVNTYGSHHTDGIISLSRERAERFMSLVDSASVMWNASTRFADGYRYGLGAEVGISTSKIHARGPVGLEGLVTYKWRLEGSGQVVADYSGEGARSFTHRPLPSGGSPE
jgi:glutamate-5-semialdehyde dehydrogenase